MTQQQYTIVMPIKIDAHNHDELQRFIQIQLRSLNKFLDISSVYEFLIIGKENETAIIQKALLEHPSPLPIRLIPEILIVKQKVINKTPGWYLQQLLKLGVAKIVKTSLYLILDTDCFLTKPFSYNNLFYQDKILMNRESWSHHPDWWFGSLKIINDVPLTTVAAQLAIAVTPQILVTNIVCELLDYLSHNEESSDWDEYLFTKSFTEFTLYWLFLLKTNRTDLYQSYNAGPLLLGNALWTIPCQWLWVRHLTLLRRLKKLLKIQRRKPNVKIKMGLVKQFIEQQVKSSFESNDYFYFSLIQSNIKEISLDWIIEQTNKYLS